MREAKFKAWDKHRKCWIKDCDLIMEASGRVWAGDINNPPMVQIESENVVFYTGLKDKNGVEIFEGDIYHQGDPNITYTVVWRDTGLIGKQNGSSSYAGLEYWQDRIEVIGNIYENPELLEVQP